MPILALDQVFADPPLRTFGLVPEPEHPAYGPVKVPVGLSRTPPTVRAPAPEPGAHTREILSTIGYDAIGIDDLAGSGVIEVTK